LSSHTRADARSTFSGLNGQVENSGPIGQGRQFSRFGDAEVERTPVTLDPML
jgi:hypothetical protein